MSQPITREQLLQVLHNQGLDIKVGIGRDEPFLAEVTYLRHWLRELDEILAPEPDEDAAEGSSAEYEAEITLEAYEVPEEESGGFPQAVIEVSCPDDNPILLVYTDTSGQPGHPALTIIYSDMAVYLRNASQDPATEWEINIMAGDPEYVDANGRMVFSGDHTNI